MSNEDSKHEVRTGGGEGVQGRLDELTRLRDEIRLKIHLLEMDARDAFRKIEPSVEKAENEATHLAKGAAAAVTQAFASTLDSLAESMRKIRSQLPK